MTERVDVERGATADASALEQELERHLIEQGFERLPGLGAARWTGQRNGRKVELAVTRQARTRYAGDVRYRHQLGFLLSARLSTKLMTRLSLVREQIAGRGWVRWLHRRFGREQVDAAPAGLDGFRAVAADRAWAERLLTDSRAVGLMPALLAGEAAVGHKAAGVQFMPGELLYTSPTLQRDDFRIERVQPLLDGLAELAQVAETLPPPDKPSSLSSLERLGRDNPRKLAFLIIGAVFGALMLVSAVVIGLLLWVATR